MNSAIFASTVPEAVEHKPEDKRGVALRHIEPQSGFEGVSLSELEALEELQKLGLTGFDGQPLDMLISLAQSRSLALRQLAEARKDFDDGIRNSNDRSMSSAFEKAQGALGAFREIRYPEGQTFASRRSALQSDLAQTRALLAAIDTWWWQRFARAIAGVYANLKMPDKALEELEKARTILERWPKAWPEGVSSARKLAEGTIKEAAEEVDNLLLTRCYMLLDEVEAWITLAQNAQGGDGGSQAALEYLVHAEASYKAAQRTWNDDKSPAKNQARGRLDATYGKLEEERKRVFRQLPQIMIERRRRLIDEKFREWRREYSQAAGADDQNWSYLLTNSSEQAQELRRCLDELIILMRLDPDYSPEDKYLNELIRRREENLRRSAELIGEVRRLGEYVFSTMSLPADTSGRNLAAERYLCLMSYASEEAKRLNPDLEKSDEETRLLLSKIGEQWTNVQQEIEQQIDTIRNQLRTTQDFLDSLGDAGAALSVNTESTETRSDELAGIQKKLDNVHRGLQDAEQKLKDLERRLSSHSQVQPKWNAALAELQTSWNSLSEQLQTLSARCQAVEELAKDWQVPHDLMRLISRTQALCRQDKLPTAIRRAALEHTYRAVRDALPVIRRRQLPIVRQIELTLLLRELLEVKKK